MALLLLLAVPALTLSTCGEEDSLTRSTCLSEGLAEEPMCAMQDGKTAIYLRTEFGSEFTHALPTAYALHRAGQLGVSCGCGSNVQSLYYFNAERHWDAATCKRTARKSQQKAVQMGWVGSFGGLHGGHPTLGWEPPPLRAHFRALPLQFPPTWDAAAPLVLFYNKFSMEWGGLPTNTVSLAHVQAIVGTVLDGQELALVYSRTKHHHDKMEKRLNVPEPHEHDWMHTRNATHGVRSLVLEDLAAFNPGLSYNDIQFRLLARARAVVTVQGGTAIMAGYFCRDILVMHRRGKELKWPRNEYEERFSRFLGARYRIAFDSRQLTQAVAASVQRWSQAQLPPGLPPGAAQAPQTPCTSFRTLLPTTSRLGDRMLDTLSVTAVARLAAPGAPCTVLQSHAQYSLADVQWGACTVAYVKDAAAERHRTPAPGECSVDLRAVARLPLLTGAAEATRNCGACGGSAPPIRLLQVPAIAALLPPDQRRIIDLEASFLAAAREIRLVPGLRASAVTEMRHSFPKGTTGLHIRRGDKVKDKPLNAWSSMLVMHSKEADWYLEQALAYLHRLPKPFSVFLATDDTTSFADYAARVAAVGGTVVNKAPQKDDPWMDLFMLAECDSVVMASKYSTFAIVSSMLRHTRLVTFKRPDASLLQVWRSLLVLPAEARNLQAVKGRHAAKETRWSPVWEEWAWTPPNATE